MSRRGGQTVSGDNPEDGRNDKVAEGTNHGHEELSLVIDVTPWLQSADERSAFWDGSDDSLALGVLGVNFLGIGRAACFACRHNGGGHGLAVVHCLFNDEEGEDEECSCKGNLNVEVKSPGVASC